MIFGALLALFSSVGLGVNNKLRPLTDAGNHTIPSLD